MAVVVALDAQRRLGQIEPVLQLVERLRPGVVIGTAAQPVAEELFLGVVRDRLLQAPLVAPLGHLDGHPQRRSTRTGWPGGVALLHEELLVDREVHREDGDEHLLRVTRRRLLVVQLLQHLPHELGLREVFDLVDDEALAAHDAALADVEDLDGSLELVLDEADHVDVVGPLGHHLLLLDGLAHADEPVARASRQLELKCIGGREHLRLKPLHERIRLAVEEVDEVLHEEVVGRLLDLVHARARALLDVEQQARPAELGVRVQLVVGTGADREAAQQQIERLANGIGVAIRAEVLRALVLRSAPDHRSRPLVRQGDGEEGVALVVTQPDVEARPELLDEAVLEHERLDLGAHRDPLDRLRGHHHLRRLRVQQRRVPEVAVQPGPERLRLADVDDPTFRILELIRARLLGDRACRRSLHHVQQCAAPV